MSKQRKTVEGAIPFCRLPVGQTFRHDSEWAFPFSGMKTGLAIKTSTLNYRYIEDGMECRVGNKNTGVVPTDK
jgi:hypothetical protein